MKFTYEMRFPPIAVGLGQKTRDLADSYFAAAEP